MKKFLTVFASFALILVAGISLASCGGGGNSIVDTSGNYEPASTGDFATATEGYTPTSGGYEFRMEISASEGTPIGSELGLELEELDLQISYSGLIDANNNAFFEGGVYLKGESQGLELKYDVDGSTYYNAKEMTYYSNVNGEKVKYTHSAPQSLFESFYGMFNGIIDSEGLVSEQLSAEGATYQIATDENYTKIRADISEESSGVLNEGALYLIMDSEKNFVAFRMEASIFGMNQMIEFVATDAVVEFPEDLASYVEVTV